MMPSTRARIAALAASMGLALLGGPQIAERPGLPAAPVITQRAKKWNLLTGGFGVVKAYRGKRVRMSVAQCKRAAQKRRNVRRNRRAHR